MTYGMCFICVYSLYADDCLLYRKIDSGSDCEMLQNDLMDLELWPRKCLIFNVEKCEVIHLFYI